jgi:hypothetical protein
MDSHSCQPDDQLDADKWQVVYRRACADGTVYEPTLEAAATFQRWICEIAGAAPLGNKY